MNTMVNVVAISDRQSSSASCQTCMKRALCPVLDMLTQTAGAKNQITMKTWHPNDNVIEAGQEFDGLYMVRSGFFKSSFIDSSGELQVTGFHFPGEIFGLEGIDSGHYGDTVTALDTGSICRIPFSLISGESASAQPSDTRTAAARASLIRLMSGTISRDRSMIFNLGRMDAGRRFATFLLDIAERMQKSGYDRDNFKLCMSRIDISNYLCLALETVSRLFTQFHTQGLIHIDKRDLRIVNRQALQTVASGETPQLGKVVRSAPARKNGLSLAM